MTPKRTPEEPVRFVTCPQCGNEQADMGRGVECESCGYGPMPCQSPPVVKVKRTSDA